MKLPLLFVVVSSLIPVRPSVPGVEIGTANGGPRPERAAVTASPQTRSEALPAELRQKLRKKIDGLLRAELTTHWYPHAVNRERGGFHQSMARDWSLRTDENVFLVYQARMTWTAAAFRPLFAGPPR